MFYRVRMIHLSALKRFHQARGLDLAMVLAYNTLLGFVPTCGFVMWLLQRLPLTHEAPHLMHDLMSHALGALAPSLQPMIDPLIEQASHLPVRGLLLLLVSTLWTLSSLQQVMQQLLGQRQRWHHHLFRTLSLAIILHLVFVGMSLMLALQQLLAAHPTLGWLSSLLHHSEHMLPTLYLALLLTLFYKQMSFSSQAWSTCAQAAGLAAMGLELSKMGLLYYWEHSPTYHMIYGTLAALPCLILWIYGVWVIILLGATLSTSTTPNKTA